MIDSAVAEKTVTGKLRRWYPLAHQRIRPEVLKLSEHMMRCETCSDPREDLCTYASRLLLVADYALGLREA